MKLDPDVLLVLGAALAVGGLIPVSVFLAIAALGAILLLVWTRVAR